MYDYFDSRLTISKVFNGNDTRGKHSRLRYPTPNGEGYSLGEDFHGMERRSVFAPDYTALGIRYAAVLTISDDQDI